MKVLAVTGSRADWGLLAPVLDALRDDTRFDLDIAVTGQHLTPGSQSLDVISREGHRVTCEIDMALGEDDSPPALARAIGLAAAGFGDVLDRSRPDLVLVLGDRYEILAAAQSAILARVPIAHLCGGDITEGAIDDSIRHAITKLASLHFPTNAESAARIVQMGEDAERVFNVGSTGIDRIRNTKTVARAQFFDAVGIDPGPRNFIITFHPATLSDDPVGQARALLAALDEFPDAGLVFTGSNADPGAQAIDALIREYVQKRDRAALHRSLGSTLYFSALTHCDVVIGNSSSGIMEAPSFGLPTINIGDRQARRPRAASVIDCAPTAPAIVSAIKAGLELDCRGVDNPFGDGQSATRIREVLAAIKDPASLVRKSFVDIRQ